MTQTVDVTFPTLLERVDMAWPRGTLLEREGALAAEGKALLTELIAEGNGAHASLREDEGGSDLAGAEAYAITFDWSEGAKGYALLWRDVQLEWQKAGVLFAEGRVDAASLDALADASRTSLRGAAEEWLGGHAAALAELRDNARLRKRQLYDWKLQQNPWPVYHEQLVELREELAELHESFSQRLDAAVELKRIGGLLRATAALYRDDLALLRRQATTAMDLITNVEHGNPARVSTTKLDALDPIAKVGGHIDGFAGRFSAAVERLPHEVKVYVSAQGGELVYRETNLERQAGQWVAAEVLPAVQRVDRAVEQSAADLSRTLIDVRNRVTLLRDNERPAEGKRPATPAAGPTPSSPAAPTPSTTPAKPAAPTPPLAEPGAGTLNPTPTQTPEQAKLAEAAERERARGASEDLERLRALLGAYLQRLFAVEKEFTRDNALIGERVAQELRLSRGFEPGAEFLEVSFQAGLSQVRRTQGALFERVGRWILAQRRALRRFQNRVAEEEALSIGEKVVRALNARRTDPANAAYTSVLVTRGFIGESFHAGREVATARALTSIEGWRAGFRGAIAITGQRYVGKTHFAELIAGRYFEQRVVRLRPNHNFEIAGRREATTQDLGAALAFLRKHSLQESVMVLIEDLELWWGADVSLAENAVALRDTLDDLSGRLFFVVTMANWTFAHLTGGVRLASAFQLEINMDSMPLEDFTRTVLTRHAATHMRLVDSHGKTVSERRLADHAEVIYRSARGNVGDGLRRWAQSVEYVDPDTVRLHGRPTYPLPNFIDSDVGVVLAAVKRARYPNEYELRRYFGPVFPTVYRPVLQRLLRLGILVRHRTGRMSIAATASNEVGRILQREGLLQSSYAQLPLTL